MKTTNKPKHTAHRITALVLALLLTATTLSPTITAHAEREGGGHYVEGSGEEDTDRPTVSNHDTTITENENGTRTLNLKQSTMIMYANTQGFLNSVRVEITGSGRFVERSFYWDYEKDKETAAYGAASYIFSNKSFELVIYRDDDVFNYESQYYNGIYYHKIFSTSGFCALVNKGEDYKFFYHGFANLIHKTTNEYPTAQDIIDSGTLDLTKDNVTPEDQKADMTPVRDSSIGYLPRARYFDDRNSNINLNTVTSTIQWDSFQEPYVSDIDNYYYVEVYANLRYQLGNNKNPYTVYLNQYKKYGELKYVNERLEFSYYDPVDSYLLSIGAHFNLPSEGLNYNQEMYVVNRYVSDYYVRLLHYDHDKQQVLCGGWTKLTPKSDGGCISETGDFPTGNPDDGDDFVADDEDPDDWGPDGWEPDPPSPSDPDDPDDPDTSDLGIDTSSIGAFIVSVITSLLNAIKSILSLVGEFPDLCGHIFSFLPQEIYTMMFLGVAAIVVMRFLGR